jgi:hypothetical protein
MLFGKWFGNVSSAGAKSRSAREATFRHLGRASRGPNGEIKTMQS